ncbi:hypothetical protein HGB46_01735 [Nocardiopsis dassonvillei]|nr:hypothetical protein [Nocardiopsis dassonvillei]
MGLPEEDFNSYATHRGDHLTAQRATFANPKLFNEMVRNADGSVKQGSLARVEPEGKVMRMWEAIETYMERKQPLIIVAGADYGQGSSRDWAAKGVRLAGVEAAAAPGTAAEVAARLDEHLPEGAGGFVEVSRQADVPAELRSLAGTGHSAKFRTGGLTVEAHPSEEELAEFLHSAVELGVPFKCTAGLHHAVRHTTAEGFEQHGFLNVLLATAALLDGASEREAALVLADRDGPRLAALAAKLTDEEARAVRGRFRSFGTCSVTEPLEDLVVLGALPASRAR